jgi:multiple sugar transport system substrate-binding protein
MPRKSGVDKSLTRRRVLQGGAGVAGLAAAGGFSFPRPAIAQAGFDWKRFKGEHLEVSLTKSPRGDLLQKYRKEFEELTGMTVGDEQVPEQQHRQKAVIEFNSGTTSFDVITMAMHVQKKLYGKGKWLVDVRPWLKDASLTNPDFDIADFAKGAMDYATQADGTIDTVPLNLDYFILYWNKDIFQKAGIAAPPKTYAELVATAEKLHDPKNGVTGFVGRGLKNANVVLFDDLLLGYGVDPLDKNGTFHMDGPEALETAKLYKKLVADLGPPGSAGFNWNECQSIFALGKAAMWIDGVGFAAPLEDPTKSKVAGRVGYAAMPAGPKRQASSLFGDSIGVSRSSKKKEAAWLYTQWATGKIMQPRSLETSSGAPGRTSAYEKVIKDPSLKPATKEWMQSMLDSIKIAIPGLPEIVAVTEFRDIYGIAFTNILGGADPATELKKATAEFMPVYEKTEKG